MKNYLETDYRNFVYTSRYSRWLESENRREAWPETVDRYISNVVTPKLLDNDLVEEVKQAILSCGIMPSMRAMMTAGAAFNRDNVCGYNCSYLHVDDPKAFDEAMYILLCGTGVGFSVERQFIKKLPEVPEKLYTSETTIVVKDSKEGWAKAFRQLLALLWSGEIPKWDVSQVRPAGARLKTFGGRASGPAPLVDLFNFTVATFKSAEGRQLNSIECHDLMCKIGEIVVVGGVRRSAMISLSNLSDDRMRHAKTGNIPPHRFLANNSVAYTEKPDSISFLREWTALAESGSGERGIFNRQAAKKQVLASGRRSDKFDFGVNPCAEIILRSHQMCNLTEVVVRYGDTLEELKAKVRLATILGTVQATYTKFPYLRKSWETTTKEERLLGVSLTGIMDHDILNGRNGKEELVNWLKELKEEAIRVNKEFSDKLGIEQSVAITTVKPSGTVSQLVDSASGIHQRYAQYYIRTVRGDNKDPVTQFMKDSGIPSEPCVYKGDTTTVFSFPVKAPDGSLFTKDMSAIQQLENWLIYKKYWCEHNPSITIQVNKDEWVEVGSWVYSNFDEICGLAFLSYDDHVYQQAPYQEITEDQYNEFLSKMPKSIDWSALQSYEKEDNTKSSSTFACTGSVCEIVDLT